MKLVIGVDAGGTGTRAVLATLDGQLIGHGRGGPGNPGVVGSDAAASAFGTAVRAALAGRCTVVAGAVGVAGISRLDPKPYAAQWSSLGLACPLRFYADAVTAFASATQAERGTVLIAGTGAVAATIDAWQVTRTADGLGWLVGDEGSGLWIGLAGVRAAARTWSVSPAPVSPLVDLVARRAGATTCDELVFWANQAPRADFAALAPGICALARAGDPDAARIVNQAAERLLATLDELGPPTGPIVLAGSLLSTDTPVREALLSKLDAPVVARDPAAGAAWLAARAATGTARQPHLTGWSPAWSWGAGRGGAGETGDGCRR